MRVGGRTVCAVLAGATIGAACAGGSSSQRPVATLASSPGASQAFEAIRGAWRTSSRTDPAALRTRLEQFLAQYPNDGLAPRAHVYLALVALAQRDAPTADRELALGTTLPAGSTRDCWTVASARRLRLQGKPDAALDLLRPLVGKTVDPIDRAELQAELALDALDAHRDYEAISYMDAWLRGSPEEDRTQTVAAVSALVDRLPKEVLVGSLEAMRSQRVSLGYGADIERILGAHLAQLATTSGDATLARLLLDPDAGAIMLGGDAGLALGELATSRRGLNVVEGRTIGLLLPTESPGLRDEAADTLRGVMWALGLPRGVRSPSGSGAKIDGGTPIRPQCAPLEDAPALDEPSPEEQVRLVTRDDAGRSDRTEVSLDELAGEGASVVVAGLDRETAAHALRWGNNHGVAVIALVPPGEANATQSFGFVLGEPRPSVINALGNAAPKLGADPLVPIIDDSEFAAFPAEGGRVGGFTLLPPVSCDVAPARAGDPRFPLDAWSHDKVSVWLVSGSPRCAQDAVQELSAAHAKGLVALTLEAAALPAHSAGLRVVTASAGVVPYSAADDARDDELRRFQATLGAVTWWTALGRDAATLARIAVRQLPTSSASDPREVSDRRVRARNLLAAARTRLWTTESTGWTAEHAVQRTICAVDAPVK